MDFGIDNFVDDTIGIADYLSKSVDVLWKGFKAFNGNFRTKKRKVSKLTNFFEYSFAPTVGIIDIESLLNLQLIMK